jgi:hypothetical protein
LPREHVNPIHDQLLPARTSFSHRVNRLSRLRRKWTTGGSPFSPCEIRRSMVKNQKTARVSH